MEAERYSVNGRRCLFSRIRSRGCLRQANAKRGEFREVHDDWMSQLRDYWKGEKAILTNYIVGQFATKYF